MSAFWQQEPGRLSQGITLMQTFELRSVSHVFAGLEDFREQGELVPWSQILGLLFGDVNY